MNISAIEAAKSIPDDFNTIIEIPANCSNGIKFELNKTAGVMQVDRFLGTAMMYPANYGFVPNTLSGDGDPCDVLVVTPSPLPVGTMIRCRAVGVMNMEDENGIDTKVIALPIAKVCPMYEHFEKLEDLPKLLRDQIEHFFTHYKDLEPNKWVKIKGWDGIDAARKELENGVANYKK